MSFEPLTVALLRSKKNCATKTNNLSKVAFDAPYTILVIANQQQGNFLVYENEKLIGAKSLEDVCEKYGPNGWEVWK